MSTIKSKIATITYKAIISDMNRRLGNATYGYYGIDNCQDHSRNSRYNGVDDTTDSRNDGALRRMDVERLGLSIRDQRVKSPLLLVRKGFGVRWKRGAVLRVWKTFSEGPNPFPLDFYP